ncbi:MAG: FAD-binding oxidoreductase [Actinomycetota bacterium]|nr:FAD-binding oxidoreductase [Actinomycetota bacterium]
MGLRRVLLKWLTPADDQREHHPAVPAPPLGGMPPVSHSYRPPPAPEPGAGGLVVGSSERRLPPVELPSFYAPEPAFVPEPEPVITSQLAAKPSADDRQLVRDAFDLVSARSDQLVLNFYAELFYALPGEALTMFPSQMTQQRHDFGRALVQWVVADDPESMTAHLAQLGADHRKFDVEPRHYEIAGQSLINAWAKLAGRAWTPQHEAAVVGSYTRLASIMIDGALQHRHEPTTWGAQVIAHQRIRPDFAVVRIQPDAPYPYKAGQYLTVELPQHRRQWRQMSIASAPRADNTFDIHVRAIGGAGVSAALVMHTHPGDRLSLGPPRGNDLVVEPGTVPGGLLCVASGTGAAPISAVVESILGWRDPPQLFAFVGGRTRDDIYPVDQLNHLIQVGGNSRRVQVYGVVSDDPGYHGYRGRVESLVPTLQDWAGLGVDVLVAGPNPMIATTVTNLAGIGIPLGKIHFDQYDAAA